MRIASINFYIANKQPLKDIGLIGDLDCDSIGFQEAWLRADLIDQNLPKHKVFYSKKNTKGAREVAVALHKRNKFLGTGARVVSDLEPGEESKIFKERWITVVRYEHNGKKYAHLNYHGNAVTQDRTTGLLIRNMERVREWVEASVIIQARIKSLQKRGYRVFVTGDWNYRRYRSAKFVLAYWSPQRIFKRCDLDYYEHGLDYVAWPKNMKKKKTTIIPPSRTGSDHNWVVVDLV